MSQKTKRINSKKARDSARGEACTLGIPATCNCNSETTVLCHLQDESGTGKMGGKNDDVGCAIYACSSCHDLLDGRIKEEYTGILCWKDNRDLFMLRALKRTIRRMIENGTITIGG